MTFEQDRDTVPITADLLVRPDLAPSVAQDVLIAAVTLRYTKSDSIVLVKDGATLGQGPAVVVASTVRLSVKARRWWSPRLCDSRSRPGGGGCVDTEHALPAPDRQETRQDQLTGRSASPSTR